MRRTPIYLAGRDGSLDVATPLYDERVVRLPVRVLAEDAVGGITLTGWGGVGHVHANRNDLLAAVAGGSRVELTLWTPDLDLGDDGEVVEINQEGWVVSSVDFQSGIGATLTAIVDVTCPWPFWWQVPAFTRTAATSHEFDTGGTAPVADAIFTSAGDNVITDGTSTLTIVDSTGPVVIDCRARRVTDNGVYAPQVLDVAGGWPRWPARSEVTVTASSAVGIEWHRAWHL